MVQEMTENLMMYVLNNNPLLDERDIDSAVAISDYDLLVKFKNGNQVVYDTFANTIRKLSTSRYGVSEDLMRKEFSYRLQTMMDRKYINEAQLADMIGTTQPMISRYISGRSVPNIITAKKIVNALGCSLEDLFFTRL